MLPIAPPLTHMLYLQLSSFFHLYRWAKKKTLDFNRRTTILGEPPESFSILFCDGRIKMAPGKRKSLGFRVLGFRVYPYNKYPSGNRGTWAH
jgi:hypothetical protein